MGKKLRKNFGEILGGKFENKGGGKSQVKKLRGQSWGKSGGKVDEKNCRKKVGKRRLKKAISSKKKQEKRKEPTE